MTVQHRITSILSTLLLAGICSAPLLRAQQTNPSTAQQPASTQPVQTDSTQTSPAQPASQQPATPGTGVNPSQAPLQPVTTYPDAAGAAQEQQSPNAAPAQTSVPEAPRPKPQTEPVGAATAESVPTTGGAAAKPAGIAIAPAKQHQTRSLLFKVGAVLAAGAALGTVYALSHGTSSTPPGTGMVGVTGR